MALSKDPTIQGPFVQSVHNHGWNDALDEAILIVETAEFNGETLEQAIQTLRNFRNGK